MEKETSDPMTLWNNIKRPPAHALKKITGGRLSGMTDVNPQWRYQAMTSQFGACGIGWKYKIIRVWNEPANDGQVFAFAEIALFIKNKDKWSSPIPGIGGSMLIANEKSGPHPSDEAYKMAVTDALSVAMKMIGMAADIYAGMWDGSTYREIEQSKTITADQAIEIMDLIEATNSNEIKFLEWIKAPTVQEITADKYEMAIKVLTKKAHAEN